MPTVCLACHKKLVPIGRARKNGAQHHNDWSSRKYHKMCTPKTHPKHTNELKELIESLRLTSLKNKKIYNIST